MRFLAALGVSVVALIGPACNRASTEAAVMSVADFEAKVESLRSASRIPAVSAAIVSGGRIAWSRGFGTADVGAARPATDTTVYHLASLTKTFAATLLLQMVERGQLSLDAPVADFGVSLPGSGIIRVRHLLSHTSSGIPGSTFVYDGNRFGELDSVVARVSGKSFAALLQERIVAPLQLRHTAPNPRSPAFSVSGLPRAQHETNMARGYTTSSGTPVVTTYPDYFGTAAGQPGYDGRE